MKKINIAKIKEKKDNLKFFTWKKLTSLQIKEKNSCPLFIYLINHSFMNVIICFSLQKELI